MMESEATVLIVEDDPGLASALGELLEAEGYKTRVEHNGERAIEHIRSENPDAVLLDLGLPDSDGFEVCKAVRPAYMGAIIMLTGSHGDNDHIRGLEVGADDYVTKPVSPPLLLARLKALLRRLEQISEVTDLSVASGDSKKLNMGPLFIDRRARQATIDETLVELTTFEFDLLWMLARRSGTTVRRDELYRHLLDREYDGLDRTIDVHISRLRKKLVEFGGEADWIKTVHGKGYQFFVA
ncbi:response regulator transcription factor [Lujinxingia sediminis]|nr:response regulator transcription factor [Lujinxingia sediminis]